MENIVENKVKENNQIIVLNNRKNISISGTNKIISLKTDLIQLETTLGSLVITGEKLELLKLDSSTTTSEINGNINSIRFIENRPKETFLRKIFKWYLKHQTN